MKELRTAIMELSKKFEQLATRSHPRSRRPTVTRHRSQHCQSSSEGKPVIISMSAGTTCKHKQTKVQAVTTQYSN